MDRILVFLIGCTMLVLSGLLLQRLVVRVGTPALMELERAFFGR